MGPGQRLSRGPCRHAGPLQQHPGARTSPGPPSCWCGGSIGSGQGPVDSARFHPTLWARRTLRLFGVVFLRPTNPSRSIPHLRIAQRGDVGCILMHRGSVTVHQDAPYLVDVALGPDLRREERNNECAWVVGVGRPPPVLPLLGGGTLQHCRPPLRGKFMQRGSSPLKGGGQVGVGLDGDITVSGALSRLLLRPACRSGPWLR